MLLRHYLLLCDNARMQHPPSCSPRFDVTHITEQRGLGRLPRTHPRIEETELQ